MENASKALIIAGSILLAISLIVIGVAVLSGTEGILGQTESSSEAMQIKTFNGEFSRYDGEEITAKEARDLISSVNASNGANPEHQITLDKPTSISSGTKYNVTIEYGTDGYISKVTISD